MGADNIKATDKMIAMGTPPFRIQLAGRGFDVQRLINGSYNSIIFFNDIEFLEDQKDFIEDANLKIIESTKRMIDMNMRGDA